MMLTIGRIGHYLVLTLCVLTLWALASETAKAALVFTLERQDDYTAKVNVLQNLDVATDYFSLRGALAEDGNSDIDGYDTEMVVGGITSYYYYAEDGEPNLRIEALTTFQIGEGTGFIIATLNEVFANIGTHGSVFSKEGDEIGEWSIVAPVPIPAALPLLASGLMGLSWLRRRLRVVERNAKKSSSCP